MEVMYKNNNIKFINPTYFNRYEEFKDYLKGKIFLYSEIHPKETEVIKIRNIIYSINDIVDIEIVGSLTNPKGSLRNILTSCYNSHEFLIPGWDGCLFVYNGFKSSEEEFKISDSAVQLKFRVYKLVMK